MVNIVRLLILQTILTFFLQMSEADETKNETIYGVNAFPDLSTDGGFACYKIAVVEGYRIALKDQTVVSLEGNQTAVKGDYILHSTKNDSGKVESWEWPVSAKFFNETRVITKKWNTTYPDIYGKCHKIRIKVYCKQMTNGAFKFKTQWGKDILTATNGSFLIQYSETKVLSNGTKIGDYGVVDKAVFKTTYRPWDGTKNNSTKDGQLIVLVSVFAGIAVCFIISICVRQYRKMQRLQHLESYRQMQLEEEANRDGGGL